ncbi:NlpC/P60 family protein [Phenylobacterium kunshanense]|uniref:Peptidase P60 n=1 Tax=Phenylobacterium kunshanense TaxID=1445034 RepID=A0A328B9K7_9CAUL|nr:peptidase P60 [Phenylobacterium kunshanense]
MVHSSPSADAEAVSELLYNEAVRVEETHNGWARVVALADGYAGWVTAESLVDDLARGSAGTPLRCHALASFGYEQADLKGPSTWVSFGTAIEVVGEARVRAPGTGEDVQLLRDAHGLWFPAVHFGPLRDLPDFVPLARQFVGTPYLWGGRTSHGLDCSALVQLALNQCGRDCPRDTSEQVEAVGRAVPDAQLGDLLPGDLVFWPGHVAIHVADGHAVHADGGGMVVQIEPIEMIARNRKHAVADMRVRRPI